MPLGTEVGLGRGLRDIVLDGDPAGPAPPLLKGHSPQFSANVRCGQTASLTSVTDQPTDHANRSITIGCIYVRSTAMQPNNNTVFI